MQYTKAQEICSLLKHEKKRIEFRISSRCADGKDDDDEDLFSPSHSSVQLIREVLLVSPFGGAPLDSGLSASLASFHLFSGRLLGWHSVPVTALPVVPSMSTLVLRALTHIPS